MTAPSRALPRFLALYGALYAAFGVHSPYLPALLDERGLRPEAIGLALAAGTAIRLAAGPAAGRVADRLSAPRAVLTSCLVGAALIGLLYLPAQGFWVLFLLGIGHAAMLAPLAPLTDTLALGAASPATREAASVRGIDYGWLRGTGSAAFILGSIAAGQVIGELGIGMIVVLNAALLACAAFCAPGVPVLIPTSRQPPTGSSEGLGPLLRLRLFRRLLLVAALVLGSHALHDGFIVIRWGGAGIGPGTAGLLWSEQVAAEVIVFFLIGAPILDRLGPGRALVLAAAAGVLRWTVMAETAWLPAMAAVEPLHGLTFALLHLATMRILAEIVPPRQAATALALYGTVAIGGATALATLAAGPLYGEFGARGFHAMSALCLAALPVALRLTRRPR